MRRVIEIVEAGYRGDWEPVMEFKEGDLTLEEAVTQLVTICSIIESGVVSLCEPWASLRRALNEMEIQGWTEVGGYCSGTCEWKAPL